MADGYWRFGDSRQAPWESPGVKRLRSDYDTPANYDLAGYYPHDEERSGRHIVRDSDSIGASYDRYLLNGQVPSYSGGDDERLVSMSATDSDISGKRRDVGFGGSERQEPSLPPDASNTLFVEGLPSNCMRREVSHIHIFRPFLGFREVRLVTKESRHSGGEPLVLCFVDFSTPNHAATAMDTLQGYKFDEHDRDSAILRLQFARFPGPRSGGGHRSRR